MEQRKVKPRRPRDVAAPFCRKFFAGEFSTWRTHTPRCGCAPVHRAVAVTNLRCSLCGVHCAYLYMCLYVYCMSACIHTVCLLVCLLVYVLVYILVFLLCIYLCVNLVYCCIASITYILKYLFVVLHIYCITACLLVYVLVYAVVYLLHTPHYHKNCISTCCILYSFSTYIFD